MTHALFLDSEQAAILMVGLEAVEGLLSARMTRVDPEHVIRDSLNLQRKKTDNIRRQLRMNILRRWEDLSPAEREIVFRRARTLIEEAAEPHANMRWADLVEVVLATRSPEGINPDAPEGTSPITEPSLPLDLHDEERST